MKKLTALELQTFDVVAEGAFSGSGYTVSDISENLNMSMDSVKGVLGSLVKKGLVVIFEHDVNFETWNVALPNFDCNAEASGIYYAWDNFSAEEWNEIVKTTVNEYHIE